MEFVTNKAKLDISNYYIDNMNDAIIFYSKSKSAFKLQFNKIEINEFIIYLKKRFFKLDNNEELNELQESYKEQENKIYELEQRNIELRMELEKYKSFLEKLKHEICDFYI